MTRWGPQLFADFEGLGIPSDNLDLERYFRYLKHCERKLHGGSRVRSSLVRDGETFVCAIDAHQAHPQPFTAGELLPYAKARPPQGQSEATHRHWLMRAARSNQRRDRTLAGLETLYNDDVPLRTLPPLPKQPPRTKGATHPSRPGIVLRTLKSIVTPVVRLIKRGSKEARNPTS